MRRGLQCAEGNGLGSGTDTVLSNGGLRCKAQETMIQPYIAYVALPILTQSLAYFRRAVFVTIGQMKGQTLLPLPPQNTVPTLQPEQSMHSLKDQDKIHILESAIVTWTKQIKNVLKADPDAPLKVSTRHADGSSSGAWGFGGSHGL